MTEKIYSVPDVSCMHCKRAIEGAVGAMPGISRVVVDVDGKTVTIAYNEDTVAEADVLIVLPPEAAPCPARLAASLRPASGETAGARSASCVCSSLPRSGGS